jgi:hypothetical protein
LRKAFPSTGYGSHSLVDRIRENVIRDRVFHDIDIVGGETLMVPFNDGRITYTARNETVIFYSDRYLNGREITSVHGYYAYPGRNTSIEMGLGGSSGNGSGSTDSCSPCSTDQFACATRNNSMKAAEAEVTGSRGGGYNPTNTVVNLVAKNTLIIRATYTTVTGGAIKCVLSNDPYLNNISNRSWNHFATLVVWATKAYVYNEINMRLGTTKMVEGVNSQPLTNVIDSYSTAEETYMEFLSTIWSKVAHMNDHNNYQGFLHSMFPK